MIRYLLAFVLGVWLFQPQPRLPDVSLFGLYPIVWLAALAWRGYRLPACLVLGFAWAHGHALLTRPAPLPALDLTRPVWVEGRVDSVVDTNPLRTRFVLQATTLAQNGTNYTGDWRLRVSWYRERQHVVPGERWRLRVKLRPVWGYHDPAGFDYERWLYSQGIRYSASVVPDHAARRLAAAQGESLTGWRQALAQAMTAVDKDRAGSALLRALVVGDRSGFKHSDWQAFAATGTNHLVAISGLHIGLLAGLVAGMIGWLWRRIPALCRRWSALSAAALGGAVAAVVYAGLAGFAIPTQRALLMLAFALFALLAGRCQNPWHTLALALAAVVAWSPLAVTQAGLWLSFGAVAVILLVVRSRRPKATAWREWPRLQLAVAIGLLPLLLLFFQQASLIAPLVNLLMVPWFSLVMVPLALLGTLLWLISPTLGTAAWQGWMWLATPTLDLLHQVANWHWASIAWPAPSALGLGLALLAMLLWLLPRGIPARWTLLPMLLPLALSRPQTPPPGGFVVHLLDVGQGLAVAVRTASRVLVYDAGPRYRSGFNTGAAVVLPFLRQLGVTRIDTLIASHADSDHVGGVPALLRSLPVGHLLAGEPTELPGSVACHAGQSWTWDGVRFQILSPPSGQARDGNDASCVLRVSGVGGSLLVPGDMEAYSERVLLAAGSLSPTTVVVAPHHGSRTSSTAGLIAALQPRHVLYATGHANRWGFPKPDVATRWREQGAQSWDTAHDGAVTVRFAADTTPVRVSVARRDHYWLP
jgi:competence protein ComEC